MSSGVSNVPKPCPLKSRCVSFRAAVVQDLLLDVREMEQKLAACKVGGSGLAGSGTTAFGGEASPFAQSPEVSTASSPWAAASPNKAEEDEKWGDGKEPEEPNVEDEDEDEDEDGEGE